MSRWRYAVALAVSLTVTWFAYRLAQNLSRTPPHRSEDEIAALDAESAFAVNDVLQALVPAHEYLPPVSADDERQLAALSLAALSLAAMPLDDLADLKDESAVPRAADLDDAELDDLDGLVGDATSAEER